MHPGEYLLSDKPILANADRPVVTVLVAHTGDRPIQVGSHYHFYEVNNGLSFDREAARGMHLNIAAGTAVRFEPGDEKEVELTPYAGARKIYGHTNAINGALENKEAVTS